MTKIASSRGHGRHTPGKRSPAGEREWFFNDKVADAFEKEIQTYQGVAIRRVSDPSGQIDTALLTRTRDANNWRALCYVAFHHNALAGRWGNHGGTEVWVRPGAPQSATLARNVAPRISRAMNIRNRGVKAGNLHEVREPNQHAILIEGGFMDSTIDITAMRRNDMLAAQGKAIADGVADYYNLKKKSGSKAPKKPAPKKSSGKTPRTIGTWKTNRHGTQWIKAEGTFTVGNSPIHIREGSPFTSAPTPKTTQAKAGAKIKYHEMCRQDGHIWIGYRTGQGGLRYLPVRTWNSRTGAVGPAWGTFS